MKTPSLRAAVPFLSAALLAFSAGACSKQEAPTPPPVVKKAAPVQGAAAAPGVPSPADNQVAKAPAEPLFTPDGKRDPFLPFIKEVKVEPRAGRGESVEDLPPLQRYDVLEFKFVGVLWGRGGYRALIEDKDGRGYTVSVGMRLGRSGGTVARITDKELVVRERYVEGGAKAMERETSLKLQSAGGK